MIKEVFTRIELAYKKGEFYTNRFIQEMKTELGEDTVIIVMNQVSDELPWGLQKLIWEELASGDEN
ncbi:MAG TPA: hypothetical protein VMW67_05170 [Desulfobacteria bacterium]|nr:hypothetical protein [Desulfobacteria bacterium]